MCIMFNEEKNIKIDALQEELKKLVQKKASKTEISLTPAHLAKHLFEKANTEDLVKWPVSSLKAITLFCFDALSKVNTEFHVLDSSESDSKQSYCLIMKDRPFIVSSTLLCARSLDVEILTLLHPIVPINGQSISICYFETPRLNEVKQKAFDQSLNSMIEELSIVTNDFSKMTSLLIDLSKNNGDQELSDFITWLINDTFIFWGILKSEITGKNKINTISQLGIFSRKENERFEKINSEILDDIEKFKVSNSQIFFSRLTVESIIQRSAYINHILIKGKDGCIYSIVGIYSSKALTKEASHVPILKNRLQKIIAALEVKENSFDFEYVMDTMDRMPKDYAFRLPIETMRQIVTSGIGFYSNDKVNISYYDDPEGRSVLFLVIIPKDKVNTSVRLKILSHLESLFNVKSRGSEFYFDVSLKLHAKMYISLPVSQILNFDRINLTELNNELSSYITTWSEKLREVIISKHSDAADVDRLLQKYGEVFPLDYQSYKTPEDTLRSIATLENLSKENPLAIDIEQVTAKNNCYEIIIHSYNNILGISKTLPILQNAGVDVISASSFELNTKRLSIHIFEVEPRIESKTVNVKNLAEGLKEILLGKCDNDPLNALLTIDEFSPRKIQLLRSYSCCLYQMNKSSVRTNIFETLSSCAQITKLLWDYFDQKFNPGIKESLTNRIKILSNIKNQIIDELRSVKEITKDRTIRSMLALLEATVRTNFYNNSQTIVFKIHSDKLPFLTQPKPLYEIYSRSPYFESIHLRSSKVSRGGIRWSERPDDFRDEVYGLMKTQMLKNSLIVPGGAKGGFIVRDIPKDPSAVPLVVEQCYKEFIRGCLSVADNLDSNGNVIHPANLIIHDEPDPYFVVAADKGTATFSNIANQIAVKEFDYWLGDAFASGGSNGYDHKLYGITAKGTWECVKRHFRDLGIDFENQPFTAVGIGDLFGDVFGNGLILSNKYKLLAAFNHRHIFIDPSPDPEASYKERLRIFKQSRSQWTDYCSSFLSPGGKVYDRFDKEIKLSKEARQVLGIASTEPEIMSGEEIISHILKAPVDLLWNGGIGTYVKASTETHSEANDGANDGVRVNANQLRARVVGEGGNLGFTQKGRIEYAFNSGRINTDAIDNSGGVDLSDHEVNLKILFQQLAKKNKITFEKRNEVLSEIAPEVIESVLEHNRSHALSLTITENRSRKSLPYFASMLNTLSKLGYLNRQATGLPDDETLNERNRKGLGLSRPEIAVCLSATKMWVKNSLLQSEVLKQYPYIDYLFHYFPKTIVERFKNEITLHQLSKNIISTEVSGYLVDTVGITYTHRMCQTYAVSPVEVVECVVATDRIFGFKEIMQHVSSIDTVPLNKDFIELRKTINKGQRSSATWVLSTHQNLSSEKIIDLYRWPFVTLSDSYTQIFPQSHIDEINKVVDKYIKLGIDKQAAVRLAIFPDIILIFEMLFTAKESARDVKEVGSVFFAVHKLLHFDQLLSLDEKVIATNKWEHQIKVSTFEEILRILSKITIKFLKDNITEEKTIKDAILKSPSYDLYNDLYDEYMHGDLDVAGFAVLVKSLKKFSDVI